MIGISLKTIIDHEKGKFDFFFFSSMRFGIELLEKAKAQIGVLKELYNRLAVVLRECPGQYYRWARHLRKLLLF